MTTRDVVTALWLRCIFFGAMLLLALPVPGVALEQGQDTVPAAELIRAAAQRVSKEKSAVSLGAVEDRLFLEGLLGGVTSARVDDFRVLAEAFQETSRTDKQVGGSAGGGAAAIERAGFARLLGLAIERGALQQERGESSYTLSTTPYAAAALVSGDTAATYSRWGALQHIGLSATFRMGQDAADPVAGVNADNLEEASVKYRIAGDRSARSRKFDEFWSARVRPRIAQRLALTVGALSRLTQVEGPVKARLDQFRAELRHDVETGLSAGRSAPAELEAIIAERVRILSDDVVSARLNLEPGTRALLTALPQEIAGMDAVVREAVSGANRLLEIQDRSIFTAVYAFRKGAAATDSNISVAKLLFERKMTAGTSIVANVAAGFYHQPDPARKQERVREFTLAASLERTMGVRTALAKADASGPSLSLSVRYQRRPENEGMAGRDKEIGVFQGQLQVPFGAGFSVPVSISWQTGSRASDQGQMVGQVGFSVDTDKLAAVAAAALLPGR